MALFRFDQPIKGVPVLRVGFGNFQKYIPCAPPVKLVKVSSNESYAIYKGDTKYGKLTVTTTGSGDTRTDPVVTFVEVSGP